MRKRENVVSVWIMERRIGQSGERDHEGGFLSVSGGCEIVLVNGFAVAVVAVFEGAACNSSSSAGSCCCCYSHHPLRHAGSAHVGSNPALCP